MKPTLPILMACLAAAALVSGCESSGEDTFNEVKIVLTSSGSLGATEGEPYNLAIAGRVENGKGSTYNVDIVPIAGTQPPGLALAAGPSPVIFSGTPTTPGSYTITFRATSEELTAEAAAHNPDEDPDTVLVYDTDTVEAFTIIVSAAADTDE